MKFTVLLLLSFNLLFSNEIDLFSDPIEDNKLVIKQHSKIIWSNSLLKNEKKKFVFISDKDCVYCEKALTDINSNSVFIDTIMSLYEPVYLDKSKVEIPSNINSSVTPTFWFLNKDSKPISNKLIGAIPSTDLLYLSIENYKKGE